jgi:hypothetical protein
VRLIGEERSDDPIGDPEVLARALRQLAKLDHYERRAVSRRKRAGHRPRVSTKEQEEGHSIATQAAAAHRFERQGRDHRQLGADMPHRLQTDRHQLIGPGLSQTEALGSVIWPTASVSRPAISSIAVAAPQNARQCKSLWPGQEAGRRASVPFQDCSNLRVDKADEVRADEARYLLVDFPA